MTIGTDFTICMFLIILIQIKEAMKTAEVLYASDSFAEFSKEVQGNRDIKNISIISTVKTYNN